MDEEAPNEVSHDPQDSPFYPRPHPPPPRRPIRHGGRRHPPPHARVPRPLPEGSRPAQGLRRHQKRCPAALQLRHRRHGGFRLQPHLARRQGPRPHRRQVRRALDRSCQSLRLRSRRRHRPLRRDLRPRAIKAALKPEHKAVFVQATETSTAVRHDIRGDRRAPQRSAPAKHSWSSTASPASAPPTSTWTAGASTSSSADRRRPS